MSFKKGQSPQQNHNQNCNSAYSIALNASLDARRSSSSASYSLEIDSSGDSVESSSTSANEEESEKMQQETSGPLSKVPTEEESYGVDFSRFSGSKLQGLPPTEEPEGFDTDETISESDKSKTSVWERYYASRTGKFRRCEFCAFQRNRKCFCKFLIWTVLALIVGGLGAVFVRFSHYVVTGTSTYSLGKIQDSRSLGKVDFAMFLLMFALVSVLFACLRYFLKAWLKSLELLMYANAAKSLTTVYTSSSLRPVCNSDAGSDGGF